MREPLILLIDLGTQSLRATILDRSGNRVFAKSLPVSTHRTGSCQEQDPIEWRDGMLQLLATVGADRDLAGSIRAIAACGTLGGLVAIDPQGRPLRPALLYSDPRPSDYIEAVEATKHFRELQRLTGWRAFAGDLLPQAMWLSRQEPGIYGRAQLLLDSTGYLNFVLTGRRTLETYSAYSCYAHPAEPGVPAGLLAELDLDARRFGCPIASGEQVGMLCRKVALAVGLPECPVISVPYDSMTAYLGAGLHETGDALEISGTVTSFGVLHPAPVIDFERRVYAFPLPGTSNWLVRGSTSASGSALEWAKREFIADGFESFDRLVSASPPGANGVLFLPYLSGERSPLWNPSARGVFFGILGSTTRADIARAVYEGICFSLRHIQAVMSSNRIPIGKVKLAGGLSQNRILNRIKADVTGKTLLCLRDHEITTLGAASVVGRALGWYSGEQEACEALLSVETEYTPQPAAARVYDQQFRTYVELVERLVPLFRPSEVPQLVHTH
ncbi:MAG: hypothetical protein JNL98_34715 [Bryobacterales bacterium]|nr:hypothetical protein [Bryobacterales bacterium]